jgi:hypothetical protein
VFPRIRFADQKYLTTAPVCAEGPKLGKNTFRHQKNCG